MKTMDDRRAQFDAECRSGGLTLGARDYDLLYDMWLDWLPQRDRLRATMPEPEDEPWRGTARPSICAEGARGLGSARFPPSRRPGAPLARSARPTAAPPPPSPS